MNGRRLHKEYAKYCGEDAVTFISIEEDLYNDCPRLHYKDSKGITKSWIFSHKQMVYWVIKTFNNDLFKQLDR